MSAGRMAGRRARAAERISTRATAWLLVIAGALGLQSAAAGCGEEFQAGPGEPGGASPTSTTTGTGLHAGSGGGGTTAGGGGSGGIVTNGGGGSGAAGGEAGGAGGSGAAGGHGNTGGHGNAGGEGAAGAQGGSGATGAQGGTGTTTGSGGEGGAVTTSTTSTTSDNCAHDVCEEGGPLDATCSDCVGDVCSLEPSCCHTDGSWDVRCLVAVGASNYCNRWCPGVCDTLLDDVGYYSPCDETAFYCEFSEEPEQNQQDLTCQSICNSHGLSCLAAWPATASCEHLSSTGNCLLQQSAGFEYICRCSKRCGQELPCTVGESCVQVGGTASCVLL